MVNLTASPCKKGRPMEIPTVDIELIQSKTSPKSGYYSNVYKAVWDSRQVAVKRYKKHVQLEQAQVEARRMARVNHENVVKLLGVAYYTEYPSLVMEWMAFGTVKSFLQRCRENGLRGEKLISIAADIAAGVEYLHSINMVHGDLATRNCLMGPALSVKIGDLGHYDSNVDGKGAPAVFSKDPNAPRGIFVPTAWWAPENVPVPTRKGGKGTLQDKKVARTAKGDVWAFGCVLFEIWTLGHGPYRPLWGESWDPVHSAILKGKKPWDYKTIYVRAPVKSLMTKCWDADPAKRPKFSFLAKTLANMVDD